MQGFEFAQRRPVRAAGHGCVVTRQVAAVNDHVNALKLGQLFQFRVVERGLQRAAATEDHNFANPAGAQRGERVVGDVGLCQHIGRRG